jgi:uncharacterized membrane protein YfcA
MPSPICLFAALCVGLSKSGFSGVGLITVALMAEIFPSRESTGILLPLLIFGDLCAVQAFKRHTVWREILGMLPPTMLGVTAGFFLMQKLPDERFRPVLGWMLLFTVLLQIARMANQDLGTSLPQTRIRIWFIGLWAGIATMVANAAGPIFGLYLLSIALPKEQMVGTSAWFFLIVNVLKLPFSAGLGLLNGSTLKLDLMLSPMVVLGTVAGRFLLAKVPQRLFEALLLGTASLTALKLIL